MCSDTSEPHGSVREGNSFCRVTAVLGLEGEEELRVEHQWKGASGPGVESGTHKRAVSPVPSGCLPLSLTVGGTVGGSGSRIAGPEAKPGGVSPQETARPREPWHTQEPASYFPGQMETPDARFLPFLLIPLNSCFFLHRSTCSDPVKPSLPPQFVTSHWQYLLSALSPLPLVRFRSYLYG